MSKELLEICEDPLLNKSEHVVNERECPLPYYSFVERYISHDVVVHIHIFGAGRSECILLSPSDQRVLEHLQEGEIDTPVLVDVTEFVQNPEIGSARVLPGSVRLQPLDFCTSRYGDAGQGALGDFITEALGISADGERCVITGIVTRSDAQFPCKVVNGTSEILKTVANDVGDLPGKIGSHQSYRVSCSIGPDFALCVVEVPSNCGLERIMVFLCPAKFETN
jgi:hypothetical protein